MTFSGNRLRVVTVYATRPLGQDLNRDTRHEVERQRLVARASSGTPQNHAQQGRRDGYAGRLFHALDEPRLARASAV